MIHICISALDPHRDAVRRARAAAGAGRGGRRARAGRAVRARGRQLRGRRAGAARRRALRARTALARPPAHAPRADTAAVRL